MNFLFDKRFPKSARPVLHRSGHQVFDSRLLGAIRSPDEEIMMLAIEKSAAVLNTDRDFFHTLGRQYPEHHGVVVIALRQPNRLGRLEWFLEHIHIEKLAGRTFQLRDRTWMVYPPI